MRRSFCVLGATLLAASAFAAEVADAEHAPLPEHVYFKSTQQGFAWESEYALLDGKLWIRPNEETTKQKGKWTLFEGTGVPFGDKAQSFTAGQKLVQFGTDGTMILAVSDTGRF